MSVHQKKKKKRSIEDIVRSGDTNTLRTLLESKALSPDAMMNSKIMQAKIPLLHFTLNHHCRLTSHLVLDNGANIHQVCQHYTALHYACYAGLDCIIERLVDLKADVNALAPYDVTPLDVLLSMHNNNKGIETVLLADADQTLIDDGTLHYWQRFGGSRWIVFEKVTKWKRCCDW